MNLLCVFAVLVKEGRVCPFVAYIREGECTILQDISSLINPAKKKVSEKKKKLTPPQAV